MNKKQLAQWLGDIAGSMQGASEKMKEIYGKEHSNSNELLNASLLMREWVEEIKKDVKKG